MMSPFLVSSDLSTFLHMVAVSSGWRKRLGMVYNAAVPVKEELVDLLYPLVVELSCGSVCDDFI